MRLCAALLAAVLCGIAGAGCGDGAEPGAPNGASLVLDFQPNAVHTGLYAAQARGYFENEGVELEIREPSSTADGAKLLEAGRADFAILDINDLGLARERGLDIVAIAAIVQRPLASVIAADEGEIKAPSDLEGKTVGLTGVPSDDAVLDTVMTQGGLAPDSVTRQTIGFKSVALLASGTIDAATAFWNAEGVELRQQGIPTREFRVDEFGAPRYPELVLAARGSGLSAAPDPEGALCGVLGGLERGYADLAEDPNEALTGLLAQLPAGESDPQRAQLAALVAAKAFTPTGGDGASSEIDPAAVRAWRSWAEAGGLLSRDGDQRTPVAKGFDAGLLDGCLNG